MTEHLALPALPTVPTPALTTPYTLQLSGPRPVQRCRLVLNTCTSGALASWLEVRQLGKAAPEALLIVGSAAARTQSALR